MTLLDDLEDPDDTSSRDTVLDALQTARDTVELQTSYSELKELPLEDVLVEDEDIENLLVEKQNTRLLDPCLVIVTVCDTVRPESYPTNNHSSKKLINRSLAKLLEPNTRLPTDNFALTDVVEDKVTAFYAEIILSEKMQTMILLRTRRP